MAAEVVVIFEDQNFSIRARLLLIKVRRGEAAESSPLVLVAST